MLSINKKAIIFILLLSTFGFSISFAQNSQKKGTNMADQEIEFMEGNWSKIAAQAKKDNKYIFVDAYATWCGPCNILKSETFKEKEAATFFNKNFINATIDMESKEGSLLAEKWNITAYPTLLFFNPQGKLVMKNLGFVNGKQLIEFGEQALMKK